VPPCIKRIGERRIRKEKKKLFDRWNKNSPGIQENFRV